MNNMKGVEEYKKLIGEKGRIVTGCRFKRKSTQNFLIRQQARAWYLKPFAKSYIVSIYFVTRASGAASNIKALLVEPYPRVHRGQLLLIRPLLRSPRDVASPITTTTVQKRQQRRRQRPEN
jgi:hypothetical protein